MDIRIYNILQIYILNISKKIGGTVVPPCTYSTYAPDGGRQLMHIPLPSFLSSILHIHFNLVEPLHQMIHAHLHGLHVAHSYLWIITFHVSYKIISPQVLSIVIKTQTKLLNTSQLIKHEVFNLCNNNVSWTNFYMCNWLFQLPLYRVIPWQVKDDEMDQGVSPQVST